MGLSVALASFPYFVSYSFRIRFSPVTFIREFIYFVYSFSVCRRIRVLKKASSCG